MSASTYDQVPYESPPCWQSHPDRLATVAWLSGVEAASPERCRVLELGCGLGDNLIPMAVSLPASSFLGVDLSPRQVEEASAEAKALELANLEFRLGDLQEIDEGWGEFDFIVCHGVFSWVTPQVQDRILAVCAERLAPNGVVYLSYNTYPGWGLRRMIRELMLFHTGPMDDPAQKIAQSRAVLDFVARGVAKKDPDDPYGRVLAQEVEIVRGASDSYLFHEHLEQENHPVYFHELVGRAAQAGLQFLCESSQRDLTRFLYAGRRTPPLARGEEEFLRLEQYADFFANRPFRASLLCKAGVELRGEPPARVIERLWIAAPSPEESNLLEHLEGELELAPVTLAALEALGEAWPQAVHGAQLHAAARGRLPEGADDDGAERLSEDVVQLYARTHLELRPRRLSFTAEVAARPVGCPLARHQAAREQEWVSTRRHDGWALSNYQRRLLSLLDGSRDHDQLLEELVAMAVDGRIEVKRGDEPLSDAEALREVFAETLPDQLAFLAGRLLLIA
jgi:SAM-dependent methyltransferase